MTKPISHEQREEIQKYLDMPTEHGFMIHAKPAKELVKTLLSSEQAWREEVEKLSKGGPLAKQLIVKNERLKEQLNQAVEALKYYSNKENYTLCESLNTQPVIDDNGLMARITLEYLSSLSQGTEGSHESNNNNSALGDTYSDR